MAENEYANAPNMSRSEDIIQSILDNTEYDEAARSRIEYLLIELKNAIAAGGGGGSVTSYAPLTEKPKIDNHTLQAGNNSSSDLGLQTKLTFDSAPAENSTNPVTSGGVYTALGTKANSADVYNKSAVDTALVSKADKSTTYTKTEVDAALSAKQNTISDLSTIRSGAALGSTAIQPVSGKGLSTNDFTTAEKNKLAGIEVQANKTVVDDALSSSSSNPVQNKVVKSALDGKQNTLTTAQLAAVNSGITSSAVAQIETNKNNILLLNNYGGGKNHLNYTLDTLKSLNTVGLWSGNAYTRRGITFTINSDMTISASGTNDGTGDAWFDLSATTTIYGGLYGSGCPTGGSSSTYEIQFGGSGKDYGSGASISTDTIAIGIVIRSGTTAPTVPFKPMICTSEDWQKSHDYQPYAMSNVELTAEAEIQDISNQIKAATGYTIDSLTKLYRQGNRVFGQVIISKDEGSFGVAQETIAVFKSGYKPKDIQIQSCGFGASAYNVQYLGYAYMQLATATSSAGSLIVKGYQSDVGSFVNLHVDFAI